MIKWLIVFLNGLVFDSLYVLWNHSIVSNKTTLAAFLSVAITAVGAIGTLIIVDDHTSLVPQLAGVFVGNYVGMLIKKKISR